VNAGADTITLKITPDFATGTKVQVVRTSDNSNTIIGKIVDNTHYFARIEPDGKTISLYQSRGEALNLTGTPAPTKIDLATVPPDASPLPTFSLVIRSEVDTLRPAGRISSAYLHLRVIRFENSVAGTVDLSADMAEM
jgi:hypothetical protein